MNRRSFVQLFALAASPYSCLAATTPRSPASITDLTKELMATLSLPENFVIAGTGALLNIAKRRLPRLEFADVSEFLPGTVPLLHQAAKITASGLPSSIGEMPTLVGRFGLPPETTIACQEFILSYLRTRQGRKVAGLLTSAWRY